jgi:hypothetical protein
MDLYKKFEVSVEKLVLLCCIYCFSTIAIGAFHLLSILCFSKGVLPVYSMVPLEWIYQLPYQKFLQPLIRSEEVMTSLSFISFFKFVPF